MRALSTPLIAAILMTAASPAIAQSFTGARVEALVGYDRVNDEDVAPSYVGMPGSLDGVRVGGGVGYDWAVSPTLVLGIEASAGWTTGSVTAPVPQNAAATLDFGRDLDAMARVGVRVGQSALVYAKAGYANSRLDFRYASAQTGFAFKESSVADGWRAGVGVEKALGRRAYVKGEYRYTGYRDESYDDNARHQLLLGAGIRF